MPEPYAYISVWVENEDVLDAHELLNQYRTLKDAAVGGFGLEAKEFNAAIDEYLSTGSLKSGTEIYSQMSPSQQAVFQEIKKSIKRINYKQNHGKSN